MSGSVRNGHCLCGAVTFTVEPASDEVGACHCNMCRRWACGPFMAIDCGSSFKTDCEEYLQIFDSSEWAERGFCRKCGSSLFYRLKDGSGYHVSVDAIDGLPEVKLAHEVFIDEKPAYYTFAQTTRQMTGAELFAMFAPKDD